MEYYDRLDEVRMKGNYEQWVGFFLDALIYTCKDSIATIGHLEKLLNDDYFKIKDKTDSVKKLFTYLGFNPIIDVTKSSQALGFSYNTTLKSIETLKEAGVLVEFTTAKRNKVFGYKNYLNILTQGED